MKSRILFTAVAIIAGLTLRASAADPAASASPSPKTSAKSDDLIQESDEEIVFTPTYQFIFFATLEGLYRDGVSDADVDSLLARKDGGGYLNFIYTCPICMPVEGAILTYKLRPRIDFTKLQTYQTMQRTFGPGLPADVSEALKSDKASIRLKAVNELVSKWIQYRMDHSSLTVSEKKTLVDSLKKGRDEGMQALHDFAKNSNGPHSMDAFAAGYEDGDECAICNAALQMPLKLKTQPPSK
jgi:hypothetical protein